MIQKARQTHQTLKRAVEQHGQRFEPGRLVEHALQVCLDLGQLPEVELERPPHRSFLNDRVEDDVRHRPREDDVRDGKVARRVSSGHERAWGHEARDGERVQRRDGDERG